MTVWDSKTAKDVLIALSELNVLIRENVASDKNAYETHYFQAQLNRYYYSLQIILENFNKKIVLDIGNYPSHLQKCLLSLGYEVDGVDLIPERIPDNLKCCRERTICWDIEKEQYPVYSREKYDSIILLEVIESLTRDA